MPNEKCRYCDGTGKQKMPEGVRPDPLCVHCMGKGEMPCPAPLKVKVRNMTSNSSYTPVKNQFVIETPDGTYFQSYETVIAFRDNNGNVWLDSRSWDYSMTTGKYRNQFLGMDRKETEKAIKSGEIQLVDLN